MNLIKRFVQSLSHKSAIKKFSNLDEQASIFRYLNELKVQNRFCVDIAASDGKTMSNTYALFQDGWEGLAVENDEQKFSKLTSTYKEFSGVNPVKCKVTPPNVVSLLADSKVPEGFGFLSLDIDGYDYFVLEQILSHYRPALICTEINEKIPPPLKFTVKWDPHYNWNEDHFYGHSISQLHILCNQFNYSLVELHYNNAFLIPEELNTFPVLTPDEAYQKGYRRRSDRKEKFPWNENMEELLNLTPEEAVKFINTFFNEYQGKYTCMI